MSIEEIIKMAHNYGCLYESTLSEMYSEETLLKDLKKQLTIPIVVSTSKCDHEPRYYDTKYTSCKKCNKVLQMKP